MKQITLGSLGYKLKKENGKLVYNGSLDLSGTEITALPDNLTVGGCLDLSGTGITYISNVNRTVPSMLSWENGKYIKVDGVFSEVVSHRKNVYRTKQLNKSKIGYLVTDGNGKWSHGETLKEAKEDLVFKISNRDRSQYESLTEDSELTYEEAIECYRVVTGACSFGTKDFVVNRLHDRKKKYTIAEIAELTKGEYGNKTFKQFFKL